MKSYADLNDELDKSLTIIENIENELANLLIPIYKIMEKYQGILSPIIPINIIAISIKNLKERLIILKEDIEITSRISENEKKEIIEMIDNIISRLFLINENDKKEANKKIIELRISIDSRKKYVEEKYQNLKDIDYKITELKNNLSVNSNNISNYNEKLKSLYEERKKILSDRDLYEDLKIIYDYSFNKQEDNEYLEKFNINNIDDLNKLVDTIIREQINEVLKYRFLSKKKIREIKYKLRLSINNYINSYILMNSNDLSKEIEEFSNILKSILKGELENYFEIKEKLGTEYINSKDNDNQKIITVKEVVEGKNITFENNSINKYATILELSQVDEYNIEKVREFVIKMGPEFVPIFDNLWVQGDVTRRKKILKSKQKQKEIQIKSLKMIDY